MADWTDQPDIHRHGRGGRPKRIKAAAYQYAEDGSHQPEELVLLGYIDRFGAQAVMDRALSAGEIRSMMLAENVVRAYRERQASKNWAEWATANPGKNRLLIEAMKLCQMQT